MALMAASIVTPSMIIRKCREFIMMTDSELEKNGRRVALGINDMLTIWNFVEKSEWSNMAIESGMRLFIKTDDKDYFVARIAGENIINACENSVRKENEEN